MPAITVEPAKKENIVKDLKSNFFLLYHRCNNINTSIELARATYPCVDSHI